MPAVKYQLTATALTEEQCERMQRQIKDTVVSKLGCDKKSKQQ